MCFSCGQRNTWDREKYGRYCKNCFALRTEEGNLRYMEAEVSDREATLSAPINLQGPVVTNLLIFPVYSENRVHQIKAQLPKHSASADYISSVHCRLCLTDCSELTPLWEETAR